MIICRINNYLGQDSEDKLDYYLWFDFLFLCIYNIDGDIMNAYQEKQPQIIQDYIVYLTTVKNRSQKTVKEYYLDIRMFFRFVKLNRGLVPEQSLEDIEIYDVDVAFLRSIQLRDAHNFLFYIAESGAKDVSRARKVAAIRSFFKFHHKQTHILEENPMLGLEYPDKVRHTSPRYLTVEESIQLLDAVTGDTKERDYCIIVLCLNCGLRLSEVCGLNVNSIRNDGTIVILGKGNKERILYLNQLCIDALNNYLPRRIRPRSDCEPALFTTRQRTRISPSTVEKMVKKYLMLAGLDADKYSVHKLRHSAATMMYKSGVDIRTLQTVLGHDNLNTTMVYTHIDDADVRDAIKNHPLSNTLLNKQ